MRRSRLWGAAETALVTGLFHRPNLAMGLSILLCLVLGVLSYAKNWQLPTTPSELRGLARVSSLW